MVENLEITEELWKRCIQETHNGMIKLLESAEKLLESGGNEALCAGLYTYAVEEYGKILLLKCYSPSDGKVQVKYRGEFRNHRKKFETATKNLPSECTILRKGIFDPRIFNSRIFNTGVVADLEARFAIFYCDFVESGDAIERVPRVDKTLLKNAISRFQTIALGIDLDK